KDSLWAGQKMYNLYKKGTTPWEWHAKLQKIAHDLNLEFFSSPFDIETVHKLDELGVPAYKIASLEITDIPLIEAVAKKNKPVIISTGAAGIEDIELAVQTCIEAGNKQIALLKCTSAYPTPLEEVNLKMIPELKKRFGTIVGLSDHTLGSSVPILAVAFGAKIIEKHFILDKNIPALDKDFSLDKNEFKEMVEAVRDAEKAIGCESWELTEKMKTAAAFKRSLFAVQDIQKGEQLTEENIRSLRPGLGMHPKHYYEILGRKTNTFIERGTPLSFDLFD
ncbi:MAG: pseudaminic acid synthase, partial [Marinilabiliales bacterium]